MLRFNPNKKSDLQFITIDQQAKVAKLVQLSPDDLHALNSERKFGSAVEAYVYDLLRNNTNPNLPTSVDIYIGRAENIAQFPSTFSRWTNNDVVDNVDLIIYIYDRAQQDMNRWLQQTRTHQELIEALGQIANGLEELHQLEIYHGDLKASNILVFPGPRFVIWDFEFSFSPLHRLNLGYISYQGDLTYNILDSFSFDYDQDLKKGTGLYKGFNKVKNDELTGRLRALDLHILVKNILQLYQGSISDRSQSALMKLFTRFNQISQHETKSSTRSANYSSIYPRNAIKLLRSS